MCKARGTTILLVAHRMSMLPIVDALLIVQDGRVAAYGAKDDVLKQISAQKSVPAPTPQPGVA
jgi:ABC-type protease/lipase transport system fused ATPase/permease subunit